MQKIYWFEPMPRFFESAWFLWYFWFFLFFDFLIFSRFHYGTIKIGFSSKNHAQSWGQKPSVELSQWNFWIFRFFRDFIMGPLKSDSARKIMPNHRVKSHTGPNEQKKRKTNVMPKFQGCAWPRNPNIWVLVRLPAFKKG